MHVVRGLFLLHARELVRLDLSALEGSLADACVRRVVASVVVIRLRVQLDSVILLASNT